LYFALLNIDVVLVLLYINVFFFLFKKNFMNKIFLLLFNKENVTSENSSVQGPIVEGSSTIASTPISKSVAPAPSVTPATPAKADFSVQEKVEEKRKSEPASKAAASTNPAAASTTTLAQQAATTSTPAGAIDQVIALYDFQPTTPETIGFPKDAIINILEKSGDWWLGEYNGKIGLLPFNYVQSIMKING
jgi:cytoskeletal protein RodZ